MKYNKVQLPLTCHLSFSNLSFGELAVRSVHNEKKQQKQEKQATDFSLVITKGGFFPLLSCRELELRLLLRAHQHDKDNWENAALFYKG